MKYNIYRPFIRDFLQFPQIKRANHLSEEEKIAITYGYLCCDMAEQSNTHDGAFDVDPSDSGVGHTYMLATMDMMQFAYGNKVIFPESDFLVKSLLASRFSMDAGDIASFSLGRSFVFATPKGLKYKGVEIPSVLVSNACSDTMQRVNGYMTAMLEKIKHQVGFKQEIEFAPTTLSGDGKYISVVFDYKGEMASCAVDVNNLYDWLNKNETAEKYRGKEIAIVWEGVWKMIAAMSVYHKCFPETLVAGYPNWKTEKLKRNAPLKMDPITLGESDTVKESKAERKKANMHYRSWHFRVLAHERYKRDENGEPRVVFVKDTMVMGKKPSVHTLKDITLSKSG